MSTSKKRAKAHPNQTFHQWIEIESVDEKTESMLFHVSKFIKKTFQGKLDNENIFAIVTETSPDNIDRLNASQLHREHKQEEGKVEGHYKSGEKRKFAADLNCERCHGELNEIFYRWLAQATKVIEKRIKKVEAEKVDPISSSTKLNKAESSKSTGKGKELSTDDVTKESQENSNTELSAKTENVFECPICCEESVPLKKSTKCIDGHQFCLSCARKLAETEIGLQRTRFECMHMEGCQSTFSEQETKRFLKPETFRLWSQMRMVEEMRSACIADLESCPFCFYAYVILPEDREKPFFCANSECGKWSCIECKKLSHEGRSCEEARMFNMDPAHKAEEKLAEALMRRCPKPDCNTVMIKDESQRSCNKMLCVKCRTTMCYICRKDITSEGYAHFDSNPNSAVDHSGSGKGESSKKKCPLWDDTKERHKKDVGQARKEVGKLAPKITKAEKQDEKKRQANFEQRYGKNAPRVPGEWGFAPDANRNAVHVLDPFEEEEFLQAINLGIEFRRPARRLGEAREDAAERRLQQEADIREIERQMADRERRRGLENRAEDRQLLEWEGILPWNMVDRNDLPAPAGHDDGVFPYAINVGERDLDDLQRLRDQFEEELRGLRQMVNEYEGMMRYFNNQIDGLLGNIRNRPNREAVGRQNGDFAARTQRLRDFDRQDRELAAQGVAEARRPLFAMPDRQHVVERKVKQEPDQIRPPKLKTIQTKREKENPRSVKKEWLWIEQNKNQLDNDKGEGSSRIKKAAATVDRRSTHSRDRLQAGSSRSARLPKSVDIIDLTMSDDESDFYNMSE